MTVKRAVIYPRVSMDKTGEGASKARQTKACRALCEARGWEVVAVIGDTQSAWDDKKERPGWAQVLGMVARGEVDVIVAWHMDRVTRSMRALEDLILVIEQHQVGIATATGDIDLTTDTGRMVARILAAVARAEVERKAARQVLANEQRAAAGKPFTGGPRPFGYEADGITIKEDEAEAYRWAAKECLAGVALREIARKLEERGFVSTRSTYSVTNHGWTHSGVRRMLLSPRYVGIRVHKKKEMGPAVWAPIIDMDTHLALKAYLTDPERDSSAAGGPAGRLRSKPVNLLTGIARCQCGAHLVAGTRRDTPRYTCSSKKGCLWPPRPAMDDEVTAHALALLSAPAFVESLTPADDHRVRDAQARLAKLRRRLRIVNDDFNDGVYDDDEAEYRRTTRDLRAKIKAAQEAAQPPAMHVFDGLDVGTDKVFSQWETLSLERKRAVIDVLLDVRALPQGGSRTVWDKDKHLVITPKDTALLAAV